MLSAAIQFDLEDAQAPIISSAKYPISLSTSFTKHSEQAAANLNAALKAGSIVDIDVQASGDSGLDGLEDLLTRAIDGLEGRGTIILCESQLVFRLITISTDNEYLSKYPSPAA